jgi:two-component system heavy metal sensor histidine kinase CusS
MPSVPPRGSEDEREAQRTAADVEARAGALTEGMLRLASKVDLAERFLASAAHEMKTPLANLRGELQLALMRERSAADYRRAIGLALSHTEHLIDLTNDLLTFARVSYAATHAEPEACSLRTVVADALQLAQGRKGERKILTHVDESCRVSGCPEELTRLFRNLLDNALEYSPPGQAIAIRGASGESEVSVSVEDGGKPLNAASAEALFLPFRRGSGASGTGFGLGLCIGRAIARRHGGDLTIDHAAPCVRFVVRLPLLSRSG